jgi:6-pyruvoyltetrahydropterin/6-carboxytetrahydropterin synthase
MYTITKEFHFSASHCLNHLPKEHPCSRTHGHNYIVIVEIQNDMKDDYDFVIDYRKLDPIKDYIDNHLDHQHLNDVLDGVIPTAENIAELLYYRFNRMFPHLKAVTIKETDKTSARYER